MRCKPLVFNKKHTPFFMSNVTIMNKQIFFPYKKGLLLFKYVLIFCLTINLLSSCTDKKKSLNFNNSNISAIITTMTNLMLHDITNPPLCTRFFSYATLAGYEIVTEAFSFCYTFVMILLQNYYQEVLRGQYWRRYRLARLRSIVDT